MRSHRVQDGYPEPISKDIKSKEKLEGEPQKRTKPVRRLQMLWSQKMSPKTSLRKLLEN